MAEKAAAQTVRHEMGALGRLYKAAVAAGKVSANPLTTVRLPKVHNERVRFMSLDEERRLFKVLRPDLQAIVRVGIHTGCRAGELVRLRWRDVDLNEGLATLLNRKGGGTHRVSLNGTAREVLRGILADRGAIGPDEPVFLTLNGHAWTVNYLSGRFARAVRKAGLTDLRLHDATRHTCASRLVQHGESLYVVQRILGHKTPAMTARYATLRDEDAARALESLVSTTGNSGQADGSEGGDSRAPDPQTGSITGSSESSGVESPRGRVAQV